ncbi:MAG: integrin alpha [Phycisphaerales bacterium]|nr:integrin alpha [Phycisphaerales bacterium]
MLSKLQLAPNAPERLDGLLIATTTPDGLGSSLAGGIDFNGDKVSDLVIGSPNANGGIGEVIIIFGGTGIVSPADGATVSALLSTTRTATGGPVAARIKGNVAGQCTGTPVKTCLTDTDCGTGRTCVGEKGLFGFNVANAGDVDGDGTDDLLIAAPNASPRFDNAPNDGVDRLDTPGVDVNLDGVRDEVPGDDQLLQAGLVYVVFGNNRLDRVRTCQGTATPCTSAADCAQGVACALSDATININQLGTSGLGGLVIAGRRAGDRIGGGDAGDENSNKLNRGRSRGLAGAGDVDGDDRTDILIGAILADPRRDPSTGIGVANGGEAYLIYGSNVP